MITEEDLQFDKNDDGEMIDDEGDVRYCDNDLCETPAVKRVAVSEEGPHDSTRNYCSACHEAYTIGVQHGRFHEAALRGAQPGDDSSQSAPAAPKSNSNG